ncbi:MAG: LacI family DNA-binding transcriptional regulator [Acidimicrobiales bacterium]
MTSPRADETTLSNGRPKPVLTKRPTIRDVAERAGVSFKTVSRVVNGEGGVSPGMKARVDEAVAELGFRLDERARNLRQGESPATTIGFVLVDVANEFFGSLLRGIEEVATARQCVVLSGSTDRSPERERQLIDAFVGRRVDGLIVVYSGSSAAALNAEIARGTPIVFLDLEPEDVKADLVRSDHYAGAKLATEHLLKHGHVDIAYFGDDSTVVSANQRLLGHLDTMREAGCEVTRDRTVTGSHSAGEWRTIALEALGVPSPPTAVVTAQNIITVGTVAALHELGLQRTIAQVGFDDVDLAAVVEPPITVVPQRPIELGRRAAEQLLLVSRARTAHR